MTHMPGTFIKLGRPAPAWITFVLSIVVIGVITVVYLVANLAARKSL